MIRRVLPALAALLAAALLPAPALASPTQESIFQDDRDLLESGDAARQQGLDALRDLGADTVRALVIWERLAPAAGSRSRPDFDAANPAAYPPGSWDPYDELVRGAQARGLEVLFTATAPAPSWASECSGGSARTRRVCKPDPDAFEAFVTALGRRYAGDYVDESTGTPLPRVARWSIWNEPNQPGWLAPQYERRNGRTLAVAAHRYRDLARAAVAALRATGHGNDQILLGETAPVGGSARTLARRPVAPVTFLREVFCLDSRGRRLRGTSARVRGCRSFPRLAVSGFAHHPYTDGASLAPRSKPDGDEITISTAARLTRLLDQAGRARRVPSRLPVWYTEFGYQTDPPDDLFGVSLSTQARYLNESDYIAYRNRRVRSVAQYKLSDDVSTAGFQTGLRFLDGRRKPSWDAYRLPLWVTRSGSRSLVYGQVRPGGSAETVEIQHRSSASRDWRTLATKAVRSRRGHFTTTVSRRSGQFRLRWTPAAGGEAVTSRTARVGR